jgi:diketogulonate reductase-like aldo/keto reductase
MPTAAPAALRTVTLPSGEPIPVLGQGTWELGEDRSERRDQIAAVNLGLDLGMTLIDTAEMYGDGAAERLVGEAIAGRRDEVFLVSKVHPNNATRRGVIESCHESLHRLRTDRLDLYLLHWREEIPLEETLAGFADLVRAGKIRYWGVSNFDGEDMEELWALRGGDKCATNQILYNCMRRGVEFDLLNWLREHHLPVMAYSPLEQSKLVDHRAVQAVAAQHDATSAQIALAWVIRKEGVMAIPKAASPRHARDNAGALNIRLTHEDLAALDKAFSPPKEKKPLESL